MSTFLESLRRYLLDVESGNARPVVAPNIAKHRAHFINRRETNRFLAEDTHDALDDEHFEFFVRRLAGLLTDTLWAPGSVRALSDWIDLGIDVLLGCPLQGISGARADELRKLTKRAARDALHSQYDPDPAKYAFETRLVRRVASLTITRAGRAFLATPGEDAIRLLLALEVVQSLGKLDEFRLASSVASELCAAPSRWLEWGDEEHWPTSDETIARLEELGLLEIDEDIDEDGFRLDITSLGRRLLSEVRVDVETPWLIAAEALIEEERGAAMAEWSPALERAQGQRTADVTVREAQLVAHELRNALAPVRIHLDRLYGKVASAAPDLDLAQLRAPIDNGISRAFAFVDEQTQVAAIVDRAAESFDLDGALRDLAARHPRAHASLGAPDATIRGTRRTFLLVMSDLVENAVQSDTTRPVNVGITSKREEGSVVVCVEDDGPGIPEQNREKVFDPGFSTRGSSGQGLGSARDFVQRTLGGTLSLEARDAGGTRVRITLPLDRTDKGAS